MTKKATAEEKTATFVVTNTYSKSGKPAGENVDEGTIMVRRFETDVAVVGVDYGMTMNLGNYESVKVNVALQMPCYVEEIDGAHEFAAKWVEDRVGKEINLIRSKRKGTNNPL